MHHKPAHRPARVGVVRALLVSLHGAHVGLEAAQTVAHGRPRDEVQLRLGLVGGLVDSLHDELVAGAALPQVGGELLLLAAGDELDVVGAAAAFSLGVALDALAPALAHLGEAGRDRLDLADEGFRDLGRDAALAALAPSQVSSAGRWWST